MALTSNDETDLLLPLLRGAQENPRFATFLDRLRRRTGADYVSLAMRPNGSRLEDAEVWFAGQNLHEMTLRLGAEASAFDADNRPHVRPYRVYSVSDFTEIPGQAETMQARVPNPYGIVDERMVRIPVSPNVSGWMVMARSKPCTAADGALLSNLAPYVESALRAFHTMEQERTEAALSAQGFARAGTGWILFDAEARVVAMEPATRQRFSDMTGQPVTEGSRLRGIGPDAERKLADVAKRMSESAESPPDSVTLQSEPRIDAILEPCLRNRAMTMQFPTAAMLAFCRFETAGSGDRARHFAGLHELPPREAELAIALADGLSIAEAAEAMGLTLETARNYSKRLYAKLDLRGQAELVRLVHRSSAAMA